jgi:hypothetical protein
VVLLVLGMLFTALCIAALEIAARRFSRTLERQLPMLRAAHPSHCAKIALMQGEGRLDRRPSKFAFIGRRARA